MSGPWADVRRGRVVMGAGGVLLAAFGVSRLLSEIPGHDLLILAVWLLGALVLHDAVLSPAIVGIAVLLHRAPARARRHLQGALIVGGIVTVVALPLIYRAGSQPPVKAILDQDYRWNLAVLLAVITGTALLSYAGQVLRRRHRPRASGTTSDWPPDEDASRKE